MPNTVRHPPLDPALFSAPTPDRPLRLGTRASPLAMAQAEMAVGALRAAHGWPEDATRIVPMTAIGDRITDRPLAEIGGKALWTRVLDAALSAGTIDCAVHSMKDVETDRPDAFVLAAMLPRADVRDTLVVRPDLRGRVRSVADLPRGARIGTSSARRAAQMKGIRPDLVPELLRGNVARRLARVADGWVDATLLAAAGLARLGLGHVGERLPLHTLLPAASQGAIGIEVLASRPDVIAFVAATDHAPTSACVQTERAFLKALGGDCRSPVAVLALPRGGVPHMLMAECHAIDGSARVIDKCRLAPDMTPAMLAARMLAAAPEAVRATFSGPR